MSKKKKSTKARGIVVAVVLLLVAGPPLFYYYYTTYRQKGIVAWGKVPKALKTKLKIQMPSDPMPLEIKQNQSSAFPGSDGQIRIHVGDVRRHYSYISISLPNHQKNILTKTHIRKGEQVAFRLGTQIYYVNVMKIRRRIVRSSHLLLDVGTLNEAQVAALGLKKK